LDYPVQAIIEVRHHPEVEPGGAQLGERRLGLRVDAPVGWIGEVSEQFVEIVVEAAESAEPGEACGDQLPPPSVLEQAQFGGAVPGAKGQTRGLAEDPPEGVVHIPAASKKITFSTTLTRCRRRVRRGRPRPGSARRKPSAAR